MIALRLLGWLLLLAALAIVGREALNWWATGAWSVTPFGQLWFWIHRESLLLLQPAVERYLWPPLWDPGITTILQWPAWAVLGVPGLALLLLASWRRRRRAKRKFLVRR